MSTKTKFNVIYCNHMFHSHSILKSTFPTPSFTYLIESIDSKLISVCLNNDYSLIADLHIFVYGSAECATISLKCTKVKLLMLNNYAQVSLNFFLSFISL